MSSLLRLVIWLLFLPSSLAFLPSAFTRSTTHLNSLHGTNSVFLPIDQLTSQSWSPVAVPLLGCYPEVSTSTYTTKSGSSISQAGEWSLSFENCDPTLGGMGQAIIEGNTAIYNRPYGEFVGFIANGVDVGITLPLDDIEVLFIVDKSTRICPERRFYVTDENGMLKVKAGNGGEECLGEVVMVKVPWVEEMGGKKTGFSEEEEYF